MKSASQRITPPAAPATAGDVTEALALGAAPARRFGPSLLEQAALAACGAQAEAARESLGRAMPACETPCEGCLRAARAVLDLVGVDLVAAGRKLS